MKASWKRRFFIGLLIAVFTGTAFCIAFQLNLFYDMQLLTNDVIFKTQGIYQDTRADNKITIIAIDDESLKQLGQFPSWPRSYYAQLIDVLAKAKTRIIAFDILFCEPTPDDQELATSIRSAGNVILPIVRTSATNDSIVNDKASQSGILLRPLAIFEDSAIALGHANVSPDNDGTVRRLAIAMTKPNSGDYEPALALATVAKYLRLPKVMEYPVNDNVLSFAGRLIPTSGNNEMIINYTRVSAENSLPTFQTVSFVNALRGEIDPNFFKDKIVIIGATASGLGDAFWTPLGEMMNGVQIHANAMQTILTDRFLKYASYGSTIACILILALLSGLIVLSLRPIWAALSALLLCTIYFLLVCAYFDKGTMLNMFYPPLTILGTFVGVNLYSVTWERSRRNELVKTFGRYVSVSVADKILAALDRGELKLGGEEQDITVAFADVRGFSNMADEMKPDELVKVLNIYLSIVTQAVIKYQGVINKFGGDSVMAVWNVPMSCEGHSLLAVKAAMEIQTAILELQHVQPSLPKMNFGIGINTGMAVAGNMGSNDRLEYSVIGSSVNRAARLTSITPGGKVWISDSTFKLVKDYVAAKSLGKLPIKGKHETVSAHEVDYIYPERTVGKTSVKINEFVRPRLNAIGKEM